MEINLIKLCDEREAMKAFVSFHIHSNETICFGSLFLLIHQANKARCIAEHVQTSKQHRYVIRADILHLFYLWLQLSTFLNALARFIVNTKKKKTNKWKYLCCAKAKTPCWVIKSPREIWCGSETYMKKIINDNHKRILMFVMIDI